MRYLLALVFPPLAVLLCGKPFKAALNFFLWICFIVPGIVHGLLIVSEYKAERRMQRHVKLLGQELKQ